MVPRAQPARRARGAVMPKACQSAWQAWGRYVLAMSVLLIFLGILRLRELHAYEDRSITLIAAFFSGVMVLHLGYSVLSRFAMNGRILSLRRKARIQFYEKSRVRLGYSSLGNMLDFGATILSLMSCAMYVVETYMPFLASQNEWISAEVVISGVLLCEYLVHLVLETDTLKYVFSLFGIVNIVTILPVIVNCWYYLSMSHQDQQVHVGATLTYFRFLRLLRLLRILRALNVIRRAPKTDLGREIFTLVFTVLCMIFSAAGVYQWLENPDQCYNTRWSSTFESAEFKSLGCVHFHQALYWCTIETLGRPRLIMERDSTILMLTALVCLACFLIPTQLAQVWKVLQQTNRAQRIEYEASSQWVRHLVVVGHLEFTAINMLLYEIFHPDRGEHPVQDVVLLFPNPPERDIEVLLSHPAYLGHVTYLQGSPLQEKDLDRASLGSAAGVIVLANKDSERPRWHDGELLSCIQSMKAYWLKDIVQSRDEDLGNSRQVARRYLRPRIVAQVLLPETKEHLVELPGWTEQDVVVVCSEYVSWMLGMATLSRGMATLVFNLTSHTERQLNCRTKWYSRYEESATQGIYSVKLAKGATFRGRTLTEAAQLLSRRRCALIAVERAHARPFRGIHLFPGPAGFQLARGDRLFCVSRSQAELQRVLRELDCANGSASSTLQRGGTLLNLGMWGAPSRCPTFDVDGLPTPTRLSGQHDDKVDVVLHDQGDSDDDSPCGSPSQVETDDTDLEVVPRGCEDVMTRTFSDEDAPGMPGTICASSARSLGISTQADSAEPDSPNDPSAMQLGDRERMLNLLRCRAPAWENHVVLCGLPQTQAGRLGGRGLVTDLIETLHRLDPVGVCIVDFSAEERMADLCLVEPTMRRMAAEGSLRAVSADPRDRDNLLLGGRVGAARAVVALPEQLSNAMECSLTSVGDEIKTRHKLLKQVLDTNTVITMQVARGCAERKRRRCMTKTPSLTKERNKLHCVTLLLQESTSNLFFGHANHRHMGAAHSVDPRWMDAAPLNMSPLFASGELLSMTCFDRFAVEALFTPQVVPLIRMLTFGDRSPGAGSPCAGSRLHQVECPRDLVGKTWGHLTERCVAEGRMPLGLLRTPELGTTMRTGDSEDASLPYVMANPDPDGVVLRRTDLLFVVGLSEPQDGAWRYASGGAALARTASRLPHVSLSEEVRLRRAATGSRGALGAAAEPASPSEELSV